MPILIYLITEGLIFTADIPSYFWSPQKTLLMKKKEMKNKLKYLPL